MNAIAPSTSTNNFPPTLPTIGGERQRKFLTPQVKKPPISSEVNHLPSEEKPKVGFFGQSVQFVKDDFAGAFNGKPDSLTRGYLLRAALCVLPMAAFGFVPKDKIVDKIFSQFGWETAYYIINSTARSRGGNIFPQMGDRYEKKDGKAKHKAGSVEHIAVKLADDAIRIAAEPVAASAFMSVFDTVRNKGIGKGFASNVWKDWTKGEDFGTGQLGAETNFYTGVDTGLYASKMLGLKNTWLGAGLTSLVGGSLYNIAHGLYKGNPTQHLNVKDLANKFFGRLGIIPNIYRQPNLSKPKPKPKPTETAKKTPDEIKHDKANKRAEFIKNMLYPVLFVGGLMAFNGKQKGKKENRNFFYNRPLSKLIF